MGNRVRLLRDGPAAYRAMFAAIAAARNHVNIEFFTVRDDEIGRELAELIIGRAKAGVDVNMIYDSVGSMDTRPEFFDYLRRQGIRTLEFNPMVPGKGKKGWRIEQRDHRKVVEVDGRVAFTGGINVSTEYSGDPPQSPPASNTSGPGIPPWRDTQIEIEGPVVAEFQKLFRGTWEKQKGEPRPWERYRRKSADAGRSIVRVVGTSADDSVNVIHTTLLSAIARAERSIHLTQAYFAPDGELIGAIEAAARRGIDVRIILPSEGAWPILYAGRSYFSDLLKAGVKVYQLEGRLLHAKTAVIDGVWSTVGSMNLDYRSLVKNDEINAIILGEEFASEMEAMFAEDIARSHEVTPKHWKHRGVGTRIKETIGRLGERWL